jgi:hypothetical protein
MSPFDDERAGEAERADLVREDPDPTAAEARR